MIANNVQSAQLIAKADYKEKKTFFFAQYLKEYFVLLLKIKPNISTWIITTKKKMIERKYQKTTYYVTNDGTWRENSLTGDIKWCVNIEERKKHHSEAAPK